MASLRDFGGLLRIFDNNDVERASISDDGVLLVDGEPVGGGSQTVEVVRVNGLIKDFAPAAGIDNVSALLFDPTAQPWQPNHEYSNQGDGSGGQTFVPAFVTPTTNTNGVKFKVQENGSAVTGDTEPTWTTDGSTPVADGTADRPIIWGPFNLYDVWAAETAIVGNIIENGFLFSSDAGGDTDTVKPDFSGATNQGDTVIDGEITWTQNGPASVWAPNTRYSFRLDSPTPTPNYGQFSVIATDAVAGVSYVFIGQPSGVFGTSGATEPVGWEDAMPGDGSIWVDGDLLWSETTDTESLVLTGLSAPASEKAVLVGVPGSAADTTGITLEDQAQAENDFGPDAVSAHGFDNVDSNIGLSSGHSAQVVYADGQWNGLSATS